MRVFDNVTGPRRPVLGSLAAVMLAALLTLPLIAARSDDGPRTLALAQAGGSAQPKAELSPDEEERMVERAMAKQLVRDNCTICHSDELVAGQRLTAAQWKAEVEKMIGWGSPLPVEQSEVVTRYLTENFNETIPAPSSPRMSYEQALQTVRPEPLAHPVHADAVEGAKLFAANCANCHGPNGQGAELGPNLVDMAVLLRPADFATVIREGRHRMPSFKTVLKPAQEADILAWVRGQRYRIPEPKPAAK